MKLHAQIPLFAMSLVGLLAVSGCEKSQQQTEKPTAQAKSTSSSEAASESSGSAGSSHSDRYSVASPDEPVAVGETDQVEFAIEPGSGLKINKEFPWSLTFQDADGVEIATKSLGKSSFELSDSKAVAPVAMRATKSGDHTLSATGDFSVCTPNKCYVMRDQKVEFALKAADERDDSEQKKSAEAGGSAGDSAGETAADGQKSNEQNE